MHAAGVDELRRAEGARADAREASMRIRVLAGIGLFFCLLVVFSRSEPTRVHAIFDADRDTIDDNLEFQLAWNLRPVVWISNADQCPFPEPRPVLFRARHPSVFGYQQKSYIVITFIQLY